MGFLQVLSLVFAIRNDLKKYEFIHMNSFFNSFNIFNVETKTSHFLNHYFDDLKNNWFLNFKNNSLVFDNFRDFDSMFLKLRLSKKQNEMNYIRIESNIFPEFEYHKYLRGRSLRNSKIFRLRKMVDPFNIYMDKNLDAISFFQIPYQVEISTNFLSDFDLLKSFYKTDFYFFKEFNFFRHVFSRKNLSFFRFDLETSSFFRLKFNKLSFLFRYFFFKRERFKYALTSYNFGNVNSFSFSTIINWISNYRILRAVFQYFFVKNSVTSLYTFKSISEFSIVMFSIMLDQVVFFINNLIMFWVFTVFIIIIYFFLQVKHFFTIFIILIFLFQFFIFFVRGFFLITYIYQKPVNFKFFSRIILVIKSICSFSLYKIVLSLFFSRFVFYLSLSLSIRFFIFVIFLLLVYLKLFFYFKLNFLYLFFLLFLFQQFILSLNKFCDNFFAKAFKFDVILLNALLFFFYLFLFIFFKTKEISIYYLLKEFDFLIGVLFKKNNFIRKRFLL